MGDKRPAQARAHSERKREMLAGASSLSIDGEAIVPPASSHQCLRRLKKRLRSQHSVSAMGLNMPAEGEGLLTQMRKE